GTPQALLPIAASASDEDGQPSKIPSGNPDESSDTRVSYFVPPMNTGDEVNGTTEPAKNAASEEWCTSSSEKSSATEKTSQKPLSDKGYKGGTYSVATDCKTQQDRKDWNQWRTEDQMVRDAEYEEF